LDTLDIRIGNILSLCRPI